MRLDEKGLEAARKAYSIGIWGYEVVMAPSNNAALDAAITTYISSTVPGDVRELVRWLDIYVKEAEFKGLTLITEHLRKSSTALLTLSAENATLKARLDGTVGVEHIGKAG